MTKCHAALLFDCLDLRNAVVPLVMPLALYVTTAGANAIT